LIKESKLIESHHMKVNLQILEIKKKFKGRKKRRRKKMGGL
jgi:hypothetical protein